MNSSGQQKGVDSLIVTDLIELARNHAITDALLLAGDEDVRVGVQIAQNFGVRVHLLGIVPSRGSQSKQLLHEADTTTEWDATTVGGFLSVAASSPTTTTVTTVATTTMTTPNGNLGISHIIESVVAALVVNIDPVIVATLKAGWQTSGQIPKEYDGKLLARCGHECGRTLTPTEAKEARKRFREAVKARHS